MSSWTVFTKVSWGYPRNRSDLSLSNVAGLVESYTDSTRNTINLSAIKKYSHILSLTLAFLVWLHTQFDRASKKRSFIKSIFPRKCYTDLKVVKNIFISKINNEVFRKYPKFTYLSFFNSNNIKHLIHQWHYKHSGGIKSYFKKLLYFFFFLLVFSNLFLKQTR